MTSAYKYLYERLKSAYTPREARAVALLVLDKLFGLSVADVCMGRDRPDFIRHKLKNAAHNFDFVREQLDAVAGRLVQGEPVQYVLGEAEFCGRSFRVSPAVLIPRPETAELAQWVLSYAKRMNGPRILDIGTGSGCIAVTLAKELPEARVAALDVSPEALAVARGNAVRWQARVDFRQEDILKRSAPQTKAETKNQWDVIVSNPPYVCRSERAEMSVQVKDCEPEIALFVPDDDPLLFYRALARYALRTLVAGGLLFAEINAHFGAETRELFLSAGFCAVEIRKDMQGNDRMIKCSLK